MTTEDVIRHFQLQPHPSEGGYFRRTYASSQTINGRALSTAILYLITSQSTSAPHKVDADEIWHFYAGDPAIQTQTADGGVESKFILGSNFFEGQMPQLLVPAGVWQTTRLMPGGRWALFGATVCPGFEYAGFELKPKNS